MKTFFGIIGFIVTVIICIYIIWNVYRAFFPKKYTWGNCPRDHDTLARYGQKRCNTCNSKL